MTLIQCSEHLWVFKDTCNVYVVKHGSECLLIDTGSGAVLPRLSEIGIERVDWVLHTHHHRDQCWGTPMLQKTGAKIAVPEYERHLFENVEAHWQSRGIYDNYNDSNTFFALGENIEIDAVLEDYEAFPWKGYNFRILPAKGHTYGMISLIADVDGQTVAFTGDLMVRGGKLYQLHAMEYSYGDMLGIEFTMQSILALKKQSAAVAYPSHGTAITEVDADITRLEARLEKLSTVGRLLTSGRNTGFEDWQTLRDSKLERISEHLLWGGPYTCSNFYVVLSGSGHAMLIDYGLSSIGHLHFGSDHDGMQALRFVEHHLDELQNHFGVKEIEVVLPTHIHNDHICGIPYLQRKFGTQCWALDRVAQVIVDPAAWASTPCCFHKPVKVQRTLRDGEAFHWRGFDFEIYYAPGQTEYHAMILGHIDGKRLLFSGDNLWLFNPRARGIEHEIPIQLTVMRNSFQLEMHRRCAQVLQKARPDVLCPGHGALITISDARIAEYADYVDYKEAAFREIVDEPADCFIDLFWARMLPYISEARPSDEITYTVKIRNNLERRAVYQAHLLPAFGWRPHAERESVSLEPGEQGEILLRATAPALSDSKRRLVTAEILIDGVSQGPICEALVSTRGRRQE
ncbi:MAG: MBL fold metallo-hydrolase [Mesorhizobium sp.]|uniref:MBL fold metallo-hydrolase n=1 Tax=unclassified Mesorhizobium TaxID=325217 RepID=UPI000FCBBA41|nr:MULTISPECIES: MBL fold metallo-hydrolase [unclassified Mesorhizobium]RUW84806.1 MBL fold metallo-hydrolase [Mesorhizobium sp. M1E.F.Ca.ET.063.01.1.1]TIW07658.1 MAG: MBL fold metallo-hydrolase [Mesorhizobium sp.]